jgi:hypothetical protein
MKNVQTAKILWDFSKPLLPPLFYSLIYKLLSMLTFLFSGVLFIILLHKGLVNFMIMI